MKHSKPVFSNRPKHLLQDNSFYFITVKTIQGQWFLKPKKYKEILLETIKNKTQKFSLVLVAYAILNNHYHLIIKVKNAKDLNMFMKELNGASSYAINSADNATSRKIWWNYYDHIIRNDMDFFKHLNYIHQNPIKHGISKDFNYDFSSYGMWCKKKGKEYLDDCFERYPVVDFVAGMDEL